MSALDDLLRAQAQAVRSALTTRGTIKIAGHTVPCANVPPSMASEVGHLLCEEQFPGTKLEPEIASRSVFSAIYHDDLAAGCRRFTLHSPEGGADVGEIARSVIRNRNNDGWVMLHGTAIYRGGSDGWTASGTARSATFDAPLGWQGE